MRPNKSTDWKANLYLLAICGFFSVVMSSMLGIFVGLWLVVPFYVADLLLLSIALYITYQQCLSSETITCTNRVLEIITCTPNTKTIAAMRTQLTQLDVICSKSLDIHSGKLEHQINCLAVHDHNNYQRIGCYNNPSEKSQLATELKRYLPLNVNYLSS